MSERLRYPFTEKAVQNEPNAPITWLARTLEASLGKHKEDASHLGVTHELRDPIESMAQNGFNLTAFHVSCEDQKFCRRIDGEEVPINVMCLVFENPHQDKLQLHLGYIGEHATSPEDMMEGIDQSLGLSIQWTAKLEGYTYYIKGKLIMDSSNCIVFKPLVE